MKRGTSLIKKRLFSNSSTRLADPATATVVATGVATATMTNLALAVPLLVGISLLIANVFLTVAPVAGAPLVAPLIGDGSGNGGGAGVGDGGGFAIPGIAISVMTLIGVMRLYIEISTNFSTDFLTILPHLSHEHLYNSLLNVHMLVRLHEFVFDLFTHFLENISSNIGEGSISDHLEDLHIEWREIGNSLMELYRRLETLLDLSDTMSVQWFED